MPRTVIVGAGSAGCVVAARLSEDPGTEVLLLEAGPDLDGDPLAAGLGSVDWIDALAVTPAFDARLVATRTARDQPRPYLRGRLVGGSGSVNAMLALPGLPSDWDHWATAYDLPWWSWAEVEPTVERLREHLVVTGERTPVDRALVAAAGELGLPDDVDTMTPDDGAGALYRTADASRRRSSRELHLDAARGRPNLTVRAGSPVDRLLIDDDVVTGVVLADGERVPADHVVLCAGAIETPAVLLRSGLDRPGIGRGLQDHPAVSVLLRLRPGHERTPAHAGTPCISTVLRLSSTHGTGDVHVLPMHGAVALTKPEHHGVLMAAVMTVTSTGQVLLDPTDPSGPPVVEERMLATDHDRDAMRQAVALVRELLATRAFDEVVEAAFIDHEGTPLADLDDEAAYQHWLDHALGDYFHAAGTARMGAAEDPMAVVDQHGRVHGLHGATVIDCSIFPTVPAANTHLPVVVAAERLSAVLVAHLVADTAARTEGALA